MGVRKIRAALCGLIFVFIMLTPARFAKDTPPTRETENITPTARSERLDCWNPKNASPILENSRTMISALIMPPGFPSPNSSAIFFLSS